MKRFQKHDQYKSRLDLLPPKAIEFVGYCLKHGALLYAPGNWKSCRNPERYVAAGLRHIMKHLDGQFTDLESGLPHLASAATNILFALDLYLKNAQTKTMGNYFAVVRRSSKTSGVILKRFSKFEPAWKYLESKKLDPNKNLVKTVPSKEKTGMRTKL